MPPSPFRFLLILTCLVSNCTSNHTHDAAFLSPVRRLPGVSRSTSSSSSSSSKRAFFNASPFSTRAATATCVDAPAPAPTTTTTTTTNNNKQEDDDNKINSDDDDDDDDDILFSLFGNEQIRDDFLKVWNQGKHSDDVFHCHIQRSPMNIAVPPPLSGIDMSSLFETSNFISLRKRGSHDMLCKNTTSYQDLCNYIDNGGSAIISILESDYMYPIKVQIQEALLLDDDQVSMNVYHSGPQARALNIHYDAYNVLVLQLAGQKEWIIQGNGQRQELDSSISMWHNITMMPGDLLYIPKGVLHAATTKESLESTTSTHVTIGLFG